MPEVWLPGFARVDLDGAPRGGGYDDRTRPKVGWHTWEGLSWSGAEQAFRRYPPHLAVFPPWPGHETRVGKRQYVPIDRCAYAFAGSESDDEYVIQVEVAGFAAHMRTAPDVVLEWLAREVVAPLEVAIGVPRAAVTFHDTTTYRGRYPLASKRSAIRLSPAALRAFSGHLGHQHMPGDDDPTDGDTSGDSHWDPGALPISRIFSFLDPQTEDRHVLASIIAGLKTWLGYPTDEAAWSLQQRRDAEWWWQVAVEHGETNALKLMAAEARKVGRLPAA